MSATIEVTTNCGFCGEPSNDPFGSHPRCARNEEMKSDYLDDMSGPGCLLCGKPTASHEYGIHFACAKLESSRPD
jgi:hypothetical protein